MEFKLEGKVKLVENGTALLKKILEYLDYAGSELLPMMMAFFTALTSERGLSPREGMALPAPARQRVSVEGEAFHVRGVSPCSYYLALAGNLDG